MPKSWRSLLVTGASGFVGRHLLAALGEHWPDAALHATSQRSASAVDSAGVHWHCLDMRCQEDVAALVRHLKPEAIVHLAAQSHVPTSFRCPGLTWQVNLQGTLNLLESVKQFSPDALLLTVGSADMYGAAFRDGTPVDEGTAFLPLNPYAASKASADLAAWQYSQADSLRVVRARPFNHTGPGQTPDFVLAAFARQIARIESGGQSPVLETGNLDAERDFLDVHDVCRAYIALLEMPEYQQRGHAYNIASERPVAIRELLSELLGMSSCDIRHRLDPERQRPSDIVRVTASTAALRVATDWRPRVERAAMLARLLDDYRQRQSK